MDDLPDVGPVDAHAECVGRGQHGAGVVHEPLLRLSARVVGHAGVIADAAEFGDELFDRLAGRCVEDGRFLLFQPPPDLGDLAGVGRAIDDRKREVRPFESGDVEIHLRPVQLSADVVADLRRGGRGEGADLRNPVRIKHFAEPPVGGTEIVPPLADAVRLVDDHDRGRRGGEEAAEEIRVEPFRRDIEKLDFSACRRIGRPRLFGEWDRAVDEGGRDVFFQQRIDLVLHQRDERRNHDAVTRTHEDRQLVAERFSGAGRHDDAEVAPGEDLFDHLLLIVEKAVESVIIFECFECIAVRFHDIG